MRHYLDVKNTFAYTSRMRPQLVIGFAIVAVIIVAVIARRDGFRKARREIYDDFASGMWVGDHGFMQKAGLSDMQFYLSPPSAWGERQGYCIMTATDGGFVANTAFVADWSEPPSMEIAADGKPLMQIDTTISFDVKPAPMPEDLRMAVSVADGTLTIYNDTQLLAFMYKDAVASHSAELASEKSLIGS